MTDMQDQFASDDVHKSLGALRSSIVDAVGKKGEVSLQKLSESPGGAEEATTLLASIRQSLLDLHAQRSTTAEADRCDKNGNGISHHDDSEPPVSKQASLGLALAESNDLRSKLNASEAARAQLVTHVDALEQRLVNFQAGSSLPEATVEPSQNELENLLNQKEEYIQQINSLHELAVKLEGDAAQKDADIIGLENSLVDFQASDQHQNNQINMLNKCIADFQANEQNLIQEIQRLQHEVSTASDRNPPSPGSDPSILRERLALAEQMAKKYSDQTVQLEDAYTQQQTQYALLEDHLSIAQVKERRQTEELEQLRTAGAQMEDPGLAAINQLEAELMAYKELQEINKREVVTWQAKLAEESGKVASLEAANAQLQQQPRGSSPDEVEMYKKRASDLRAVAADASEKLTQRSKEAQEAEERATYFEEVSLKMKQDTSQQSEKIAELEAAIASKTRKITETQNAFLELQAYVGQLQRGEQEYQSKISSLQTVNSEHAERNAVLKDQLDQAELIIQDNHTKVAELTAVAEAHVQRTASEQTRQDMEADLVALREAREAIVLRDDRIQELEDALVSWRNEAVASQQEAAAAQQEAREASMHANSPIAITVQQESYPATYQHEVSPTHYSPVRGDNVYEVRLPTPTPTARTAAMAPREPTQPMFLVEDNSPANGVSPHHTSTNGVSAFYSGQPTVVPGTGIRPGMQPAHELNTSINASMLSNGGVTVTSPHGTLSPAPTTVTVSPSGMVGPYSVGTPSARSQQPTTTVYSMQSGPLPTGVFQGTQQISSISNQVAYSSVGMPLTHVPSGNGFISHYQGSPYTNLSANATYAAQPQSNIYAVPPVYNPTPGVTYQR